MMQNYRRLLPIIGLGILLLAGCASQQAATTNATAEPTEAASTTVEATGIIVPETWTTISFSTGGTVTYLPISAGDQITRGRILATLDDEDANRAIELAQVKLAEAEANVTLAEIELDKQVTWSPNKNQLAAAEASVNNAEATLKQAQSNYDKVAWMPSVSASPQSLQLEQATNSYNVAQANLDYLYSNRPDTRRAAKQLDLSKLSQQEAQLNLQIAQASLDKMTLRAPLTGTIGQVYIREKQVITPGMPILTIADLSTLHVETTDLNENDVVDVNVGDKVTVTFEALPGVEVPGTVTEIGVKAEEGVGVNYTVKVKLSRMPDKIRWGMTAYINFLSKPAQ
jgi:HlyD family secretion protein